MGDDDDVVGVGEAAPPTPISGHTPPCDTDEWGGDGGFACDGGGDDIDPGAPLVGARQQAF